jgi:hypothetical protein
MDDDRRDAVAGGDDVGVQGGLDLGPTDERVLELLAAYVAGWRARALHRSHTDPQLIAIPPTT